MDVGVNCFIVLMGGYQQFGGTYFSHILNFYPKVTGDMFLWKTCIEILTFCCSRFLIAAVPRVWRCIPEDFA